MVKIKTNKYLVVAAEKRKKLEKIIHTEIDMYEKLFLRRL